MLLRGVPSTTTLYVDPLRFAPSKPITHPYSEPLNPSPAATEDQKIHSSVLQLPSLLDHPPPTPPLSVTITLYLRIAGYQCYTVRVVSTQTHKEWRPECRDQLPPLHSANPLRARRSHLSSLSTREAGSPSSSTSDRPLSPCPFHPYRFMLHIPPCSFSSPARTFAATSQSPCGPRVSSLPSSPTSALSSSSTSAPIARTQSSQPIRAISITPYHTRNDKRSQHVILSTRQRTLVIHLVNNLYLSS